MKVLIADDSRLLRERLVEMLSELRGIEMIDQAQDAAEVTESVSRLKYHVMILDMHMAGESGIDILKRIKRDHPSTLVIIFTNYLTDQYRKRCMDAGADYFFDKLTESEKVIDVLRELIHDSPS